MNFFNKAFESWGGKIPQQHLFDREKWQQDLKRKADEKYFKSGAAEGLVKLNLGFCVPSDARLAKNYNRFTGDLPGDDLVQWLLYLDYICFLDGLLDLSEFDACWQETPCAIRKALLRWYLSTISPLSKYVWKKELPSDDPAFYALLEKEHSNLVVVYPYVFLPKDVPFLFDSSIAPPGSGTADAYHLDAQTVSIALFSSDLFAAEDFDKAISNENPVRPTFENQNGIYYARIPAESTQQREYTTADGVNRQSTDFTMALERGALDTMLPIAQGEATKRSGEQKTREDASDIPAGLKKSALAAASLSIGVADSPLPQSKRDESQIPDSPCEANPDNENGPHSATVLFPLSALTRQQKLSGEAPIPEVLPTAKARDQNDLFLKQKETFPNSGSEPYCQPLPIDPTRVEKDMSETYWKAYNAQAGRDEPHKKLDFLNPERDDIFPKISLPKDGEQLSIGSGITQRILGSGGQGVVYLSWNTVLELFRAVKLLKPPPNVVEPREYRRLGERFFREIKVQSNMNHGNLAQIYAFGEWNRYLFFEMEYIEGVDTKSLLQTNGKLFPVVAVAVLIQSLQGLHYAHNKSIVMDGRVYRGFIHRDIKPANVMISKDGYVKVLDFGIGLPVGMISLTMQHGGLVGTAPYMSPEQVRGRELDYRSDLFSLGTVFYEMITGMSAFGNGSTIHQVMSNVIEGNYKKIDSFNLKIPKSIKYIIKKSLERDPNKRFESAAAMLSVCNEALRDLTKEIPEAVIQDFVRQQAFCDATSAHTSAHPSKKKKRFFGL